MKKLFNITRLLLAMAIFATTTVFTSCNKDDDENGVLGSDTKYSYIEPCLKWHSTQDEVASFMNSKDGWLLMEGNEHAAIYSSTRKSATITYAFGSEGALGGLMNSTVTYLYSDNSAKMSLISDLQNRYKVTIEKADEEKVSTGKIETYSARATIGGSRCTILLLVYTGTTNTMSVSFSLNL